MIVNKVTVTDIKFNEAFEISALKEFFHHLSERDFIEYLGEGKDADTLMKIKKEFASKV